MKILHGVAVFAAIVVWSSGKLVVVRIFVTVHARGKLHLIDGVFSCGDVAFRAFDCDVLPFQGIARSVVLLHPE